MAATQRLTAFQAEVLAMLRQTHGDGSIINLQDYARHTSRGPSTPAALKALARLGYLEHHPDAPSWALAWRLVASATA